MRQILTQFTIISVLFQCIQGYTISHFKSERRSESLSDHFPEHELIRNGATVDTSPNLPRVSRQGGNNPSAYSYSFTRDNSNYSRTYFSLGEGSEVSFYYS